MKTPRHFLLSVLFLAVGLGAMIAADAVPPTGISLAPKGVTLTTVSVDALKSAEKERDDAKAQVAQLTQQNQQQQIVAEYYKAVAEKNDAVLRIVALQQELQAVKAELATAQAELAALKKVPEAKK